MSQIAGREAELARLGDALSQATTGKGSTLIVSGEAGAGKTRLVQEAVARAKGIGFQVIQGACSAEGGRPFLPFSQALRPIDEEPLFEPEEHTSFAAVLVTDATGRLAAKAASKDQGELNADTLAGMLAAVQSFVRDSFGGKGSGLGRMEYGEMKVLIERAGNASVVAIFRGEESPSMRPEVKRLAGKVGSELAPWLDRLAAASGPSNPMGGGAEASGPSNPIVKAVEALASARFLVAKNLEGVKLEGERIRIANKVLETMQGHARAWPLLLVLEDLHWADEGSLFALRFIARNIRDSRALILCTSRPSEGPSAQRTAALMRDEGTISELKLEGLDVPSIASLLDSRFSPNAFPASLAERLQRESAGNPFFVTEMLRNMRDAGAVAERDGAWALVSEDFAMPASVEEVVKRRLESLDPDAMAMAEYASCIGREFDLPVALSFASLASPRDVLARLEGLGIMQSEGGKAEFSHALFQEVIYRGIGGRWRALHHRCLGEHYEVAHRDRLDEVVYELARHFSRSGEHSKAFEYCRRAGAKAEAAFAVELAVEYYETCLSEATELGRDLAEGAVGDILERQGDLFAFMGEFAKGLERYERGMAATSGKEARARLLRKTGDVCGKKGEYGKGFSFLDEASKVLAGVQGLEYGRICMVGAGMRMRRSEYDAAGSLLKEAIQVFEGSGEARADMGNALRVMGNLHLYKAEFDSAREYYEKSMALCAASGNDIGVSSNYNNLGIVCKEKREFSKSLDYYQKSLEILRLRKDQFAMGNLLHNMGNVHRDMGNCEEALRIFEECLALRRRLGDKFGLESTLAAIGGVHYQRGELAKSLDCLTEAHGLSKEIGDVHGQAMTVANLGLVRKSMGALDEALKCFETSNEIRERINDKIGMGLNYYNAGNVLMLKGEVGKALENYDKSLQLHLVAGDKDGIIYAYYGQAEATARLGSTGEAKEIALKGLDLSVQAKIKPLEGMGHRILGIIGAEAKEFEQGCQAFEKALQLLGEVGDRRQMAELLYEYARLNREKGDSKKARAQLTEALAEFERMGMRLWAERARKALEVLEK